jgi:hypothetical protein
MSTKTNFNEVSGNFDNTDMDNFIERMKKWDKKEEKSNVIPVTEQARKPTKADAAVSRTKSESKPKSEPAAKKKGKKVESTMQSTKKEPVPSPVRQPTNDDSNLQTGSLEQLWQTAVASKAKKPKEKQVWLDADICNKIEMLNLKRGKPVPVKHLFNAILKLFLEEHKAEIARTK